MDALRIGQKHYIALWNLRQAAANLLATQTFHLFEQHESIYQQHVNSLRKQPIDWKDSKRASALPSASVVQELRLVANASKHGAGPSAVELGFWRSLCERGSLRDEHADRRAAIVRRGPERGSGA